METRFQLSSAVAVTIGCLIFVSTSVSAQVGSGSKIQMKEMNKRELQLSDLSKGNPKATDSRRASHQGPGYRRLSSHPQTPQ